jgi:hypothetical protein
VWGPVSGRHLRPILVDIALRVRHNYIAKEPGHVREKHMYLFERHTCWEDTAGAYIDTDKNSVLPFVPMYE